MKIRLVIIIVLALAVIGILAYGYFGIKDPAEVPAKAPVREMNQANLTIVKAPDQTEATTPPEFIKKEYVPVVIEGTNIAKGAKASANNYADVYSAAKAIDGNAKGPSYWEGKANSYPNILTVDLKKPANIHAVRVALNPASIWSKRTQTFSVLISSDGTNFTDLVPSKQYTFDPDQGNEVVLQFDPVETQYVQLVITENSGAGGGQVAEFEIYSK